MTMHLRTLPKQVLLDGVHSLANKYPGTFFEDDRLRLPLKKNIVADLQRDGASEEEMSSAEFYLQSWSYQSQLYAGAERVDLNGKKAGTVTEQDQMDARKKIAAEKKARAEKNGAITVDGSLHAAGRITGDQLRKLDAPPKVAKPMPVQAAAKTDVPLLTRLQSLLSSAATVQAETEDEALRSVMTVAALKLLAGEAQKIAASLEEADRESCPTRTC
jgi:sRNA-binding protein